MEKTIAIALTTFRELVRGKILYGVVFFGLALVALASLFGSVTIGDQTAVVKDFGLFGLSAGCVVFAVIAGASLLEKELARKTIYNVLSKPVGRGQFILGKFLGILSTTALLIMLMGAFLQIFVLVLTGSIDPLLWIAFAHIALELVIVCAAVIFFSTIVVTPILSGLFAFAIFIAGRCVDYVPFLIKEAQLDGLAASALWALYYALPQLSKLNVSNEVVAGDFELLGMNRFMIHFIYSTAYAGILLIVGSFIFRRREFN